MKARAVGLSSTTRILLIYCSSALCTLVGIKLLEGLGYMYKKTCVDRFPLLAHCGRMKGFYIDGQTDVKDAQDVFADGMKHGGRLHSPLQGFTGEPALVDMLQPEFRVVWEVSRYERLQRELPGPGHRQLL